MELYLLWPPNVPEGSIHRNTTLPEVNFGDVRQPQQQLSIAAPALFSVFAVVYYHYRYIIKILWNANRQLRLEGNTHTLEMKCDTVQTSIKTLCEFWLRARNSILPAPLFEVTIGPAEGDLDTFIGRPPEAFRTQCQPRHRYRKPSATSPEPLEYT